MSWFHGVRTAGRAAAGLLLTTSVATAATLPTGFSETQVATGMASPTAMTIAPDGRIFICQQGGQLRVVKDGALLPTPFLTVSVNSAGERGLLGVAFDPAFATNRFVYVYYTTSSAPIHNRLSRFTASATNPDVAQAGSEVQILNLPNLSAATNHNGGAIHFGPDGRLYVAVGENANGANAPALTTTLGKILRINPDGTIPPDNPFISQTTGMNQAIWARGLRNPFTFAFQPGTGRLHVNDVGENTWEEVNVGAAGANYGWPATEGPNPAGQAGVTYPVYNYQNAGSNCAIVGAAFYNPTTPNFPSTYTGRYFFGDFCGGFIQTLSPPAYNAAAGFATGVASLVDIAVAADGSLYYLSRGAGGSLFRVRFTANQAPQITQQPQSRTVAVGQSVSFTVAASGTAPLDYQWRRNGVDIAGANSPTFTIPSASTADDGDTFSAVVSNDFGSVTSAGALLTVTTNTLPQPMITSPAAGTLYGGNQTFTFSGTATDTEDGTLPASAFTWQVDFHHDDHVHPFVAPITGVTSGSFTIPNRGEVSANVFYRVILTVRDSGGLTQTVTTDLRPRTTTITLASDPTGRQLTLDGQPVTAPFSVLGVEGIIRTIGAPSPQTSGTTTFTFVSWSDGGATTHEITTPVNDTTFTATFQTGGTTNVYPAESAAIGGGVTIDSNHAGFMGTGFANFPANGGTADFQSVNGGAGGAATLTFRYALGASANRTGSLVVNGATQAITFATTGAWATWANHTVTVSLNAGTANTIRLASTGQDLANVDQLTVTGGGTPRPTPTPTTPTPTPTATATPTATPTNTPTPRITPTPAVIQMQAEAATVGGGVTIESSNGGFTGTGYTNFPATGGFVQFGNVEGRTGGARTLQVRYALGVAARTGQLVVNGGAPQSITFASTGAWTTWNTVNITVTLNPGATNTVRFQSNGQDLANLDRLDVP